MANVSKLFHSLISPPQPPSQPYTSKTDTQLHFTYYLKLEVMNKGLEIDVRSWTDEKAKQWHRCDLI
jgi:hypothetical protein